MKKIQKLDDITMADWEDIKRRREQGANLDQVGKLYGITGGSLARYARLAGMDSIIEDEDKERQRFMQEIREGLRQPWEYRVKYFGEAEEQARAMTAIQTIAEGFEA